LSGNQWGFSEGKGTITALLTTTHEWFGLLENGLDVCAIFFDYQEAFDSRSVPHRSLLTKLSRLGLDVNILRWITRGDGAAVAGAAMAAPLFGPIFFVFQPAGN